ncbi:MAG TPA: argininosuccinate lyase [Spirochaetota bacterium]|nr:argininosuccinate lyase [Spirochaetota bacterium]HQA53579.1 argininosuccinate lyase [Spirochaetota bacterium]
MKKLWGGRFEDKPSDITERISVSVHYDKRLYKQDIRGSKAHAEMLNKCGIISIEDFEQIKKGLSQIEDEIESGKFEFKRSLEDVHMNIESRLTELVGDAGKRLHTARSRNDQVATDTRLYIKDEIIEIKTLLTDLISILVETAEKNTEVVMPGYTHLQVAQPVRFSHHMLAHAWALSRDLKRLLFALDIADSSPLGAGALAGVNYSTDRTITQKLLDFKSVNMNSMDCVADRDYMLDVLYFCSVCAMHLSRFSEELILWSSSEFRFIRLSDKVTTGSSIMPQKKNPDLAELIRGKTGRVYGNMISLFTVLKGLPLAYNRDLQEDKESLFDSIDTIKLSIEAMIEMLKEMTVNKERMRQAVFSNYSTATDLADYLARKGLPFREAHEVSGSIVKFCETSGKDFFSLTLEEIKKFSDCFESDIVEILNPENSTERKLSLGSTSLSEVRKQIIELKNIIEKNR